MPGGGRVHRAVAELDFLLGLFKIFRVRTSRQILVRPRVGADRHSGSKHFFRQLGTPARVFSDFEERRLETLVSQRLQDGCGAARPRSIVERQNDLLVAQEIVSLQVLEAEYRAASGIDLDDA